MGGQERVFDGVLYISVSDAGKMLAPLNSREARRLMREQGVWPTAVRSDEGFSPATCHPNTRLWVELEEAKNLARIFVRE